MIRMLLVFIVFIDMVGFTIILPMMPGLMEYYLRPYERSEFYQWLAGMTRAFGDGGASGIMVIAGGVSVSIWSLLQFFSTPVWGRLSDRVGRKKILVVTAAGLALTHILWAFASTFPLFLTYRILGGVMSGNLSVAYAAMADVTGPGERTQNMGLLGAAMGIGMIIGPVIGGILSASTVSRIFADQWSLNHFSLCAMVSAFMFIMSSFLVMLVRETAPGSDRHAGIAVPRSSVRSGGSLPGLARLAAINFLYCLSLAGIELMLPYFYRIKYNAGPETIGYIFLFVGIIMAVGQGLVIRLVLYQLTERQAVIAAMSMIPLPLICMTIATWRFSTTLGFMVPVALGVAIIGPALTGMVSRLAPPERQGEVMGRFNAWGMLAYAIGPLLTALFYGISGVAAAGIAISLFMGGSLMLARRIGEQRNAVGEPEAPETMPVVP